MQLAYGSYRHAANECEVVRRTTKDFNPKAQTLNVTRRWEINGRLHAADAASLIIAKALLEAAYAVQFQALVLYLDDGVTVHDALLDRGSTTGVKIISGPDYPVGRGAEGGTFLSYSLVATAAYDFSRSGQSSDPGRLESWTETVSFNGGGPRYAVIEVVDGPPVRQLLNSQTKVRVTQSGQATGFQTWPPLPSPIYPDFENPAERQTSKTSPKNEGRGGSTSFQASWTYVMEGSAGDLGGADPTAWPAG